VSHDLEHGTHTTAVNLPWGGKIWCRVKDDDPASASLQVSGSNLEKDGGRKVEVRSEGTLRSTTHEFILDIACTLLENDKVVRTRQWKDKVRRELG
jgi:hypothetical protein